MCWIIVDLTVMRAVCNGPSVRLLRVDLTVKSSLLRAYRLCDLTVKGSEVAR